MKLVSYPMSAVRCNQRAGKRSRLKRLRVYGGRQCARERRWLWVPPDLLVNHMILKKSGVVDFHRYPKGYPWT